MSACGTNALRTFWGHCLGTQEAQEGPQDPTSLPREDRKGCPYGTPLFRGCEMLPGGFISFTERPLSKKVGSRGINFFLPSALRQADPYLGARDSLDGGEGECRLERSVSMGGGRLAPIALGVQNCMGPGGSPKLGPVRRQSPYVCSSSMCE